MEHRVRALFVALALPLLTGCAIGAGLFEPFARLLPDPVPDVDNSVNAYNQNLRWGRVREASAQVTPDQREKFFELFDESTSGLRFTSVEVLSTEPHPTKDEALAGKEFDVLVAFEYIRLPALDERKLRQKQTWRYVEPANRWEVEPDFAGFEAAVAPAPRDAAEPVPAAPEP
jgi:hypothetical protein